MAARHPKTGGKSCCTSDRPIGGGAPHGVLLPRSLARHDDTGVLEVVKFINVEVICGIGGHAAMRLKPIGRHWKKHQLVAG